MVILCKIKEVICSLIILVYIVFTPLSNMNSGYLKSVYRRFYVKTESECRILG